MRTSITSSKSNLMLPDPLLPCNQKQPFSWPSFLPIEWLSNTWTVYFKKHWRKMWIIKVIHQLFLWRDFLLSSWTCNLYSQDTHLIFVIIFKYWIIPFLFRSVSWVRGRDSHIITVDQETFISDGRFVSLKKAKESLWTLKARIYIEKDNFA